MPLVSIIVPVYNVEQYLVQCLESLINQTLIDIEIICVNDVTQDNSAIILSEYAAKDSRIKILTHEKNLGLGPARNTGVAVAKSKFIGFVDSDDYVSPNMFETLYNSIVDNKAEMAWCATTSISDEGIITGTTSIPQGLFTPEEVLNNPSLYPSILPVWNKLFCRELIKDIRQLPIVSEDQPIMAEYLLKCERIAIVNEPNYFYRNRQGTLSKPDAHTAKHWDAFFYAHNLFFSILSGKYNPKLLRTQTVLRFFSVFWRINNFELLINGNWLEQQNCIRNHIKSGSMNLKSTNLLMYFYMIIFLSNRVTIKQKKQLLRIGLKLSRGAWLKRTSNFTFPIDMLKILLPNFKAYLFRLFDAIEIGGIRIISIFYPSFYNSNVWLIGERKDSTQENGFYFFNYLNEFQKKEKNYYVIDKNGYQAKLLTKFSNVLQYNSVNHKVLFLLCKYYVNSHYNSCFPRTYFGKKLYPKSNTTINVFLQHGITYADVSPYYGKLNSSIGLFICGAKPEYNYVLDNFGYSKKEVVLTGFPRFDGLHEIELKKKILFMPTWRRNLENLRIEEFVQTEYYSKIQSFLHNPNLHELLDANNYELVFFPHYQLLGFLNCFEIKHDRIIIPTADSNVQQLLIDATLLITDVSSVHFDFAYMYKPIIYYCWDYDLIIKTHLTKGYFNHKDMGFGEVIEMEDTLIIKIAEYLNDKCTMEEMYKNRVTDFYPLHDDKNCERVYNEIKKLR